MSNRIFDFFIGLIIGIIISMFKNKCEKKIKKQKDIDFIHRLGKAWEKPHPSDFYEKKRQEIGAEVQERWGNPTPKAQETLKREGKGFYDPKVQKKAPNKSFFKRLFGSLFIIGLISAFMYGCDHTCGNSLPIVKSDSIKPESKAINSRYNSISRPKYNVHTYEWEYNGDYVYELRKLNKNLELIHKKLRNINNSINN